MEKNPVVVQAKRLLDARHDKILKGYHKSMMLDMADYGRTRAGALQKHREAGTFDGYELGTRLLGKNGAGQNMPFKIEGHSVEDFDKDRLTMQMFNKRGIEPTLIEHEGKRWLPMLNVSTGKTPPEGQDDNGGKGDWSRSRASLDIVRAGGYPKMGIK